MFNQGNQRFYHLLAKISTWICTWLGILRPCLMASRLYKDPLLTMILCSPKVESWAVLLGGVLLLKPLLILRAVWSILNLWGTTPQRHYFIKLKGHRAFFVIIAMSSGNVSQCPLVPTSLLILCFQMYCTCLLNSLVVVVRCISNFQCLACPMLHPECKHVNWTPDCTLSCVSAFNKCYDTYF